MRFNVGDIVRYGYYMPTDPWFMNNLLVTLREYNMEILSEV
jgi:hypothetical protein